MGTRGLTVVIYEWQPRVAQYGQWDHYPGGQGLTVLSFCQNLHDNAKTDRIFKENLKRARWTTITDCRCNWTPSSVFSESTLKKLNTLRLSPPEQAEQIIHGLFGDEIPESLRSQLQEWAGSCTCPTILDPEYKALKEKSSGLPLTMTRDLGAEILERILEWDFSKTLFLCNDYEFAKNSLFCEYAYVIDLDNKQLEGYLGFNSKPVSSDERFYPLQTPQRNLSSDEIYYPVCLVKKWSFSELPTPDDFVSAFEKKMCDP